MKGSMTVEAVFVMSIILMIIFWIMKSAIGLYQQTVEITMIDWVSIENAADIFRGIFFARELLP